MDLDTRAAALASCPAYRLLDVEFGRLMCRLAGSAANDGLMLAASSVCAASGQGHVCLDLDRPGAALATGGTEGLPVFPDSAAWTRTLRAASVVGDGSDGRPLVLQATRLYLHRFWKCEQALAEDLHARASTAQDVTDAAALSALMARHYPDAKRDLWQRVAAYAALTRGLCVITGGPGTGKTTCMATILAVLGELRPGLSVAMAAPTGKAAMRMQEAVAAAKQRLAGSLSPAVLAAIPDTATTIHRLLKARADGQGFRHNAANPLGCDVLVVDEASMVDLTLMAALVAALPRRCRLILLGDRDQLASVEAGAVLGDICEPSAVRAFSPACAEGVRRCCGVQLPDGRVSKSAGPLADCVVGLERVHRYDERLAGLGQALRRGDVAAARAALATPGIVWHELPGSGREFTAAIRQSVIEGFRQSLAEEAAPQRLEALRRFRVLCAVRHGPLGVEQVNTLVERILSDEGLLSTSSAMYAGRPIMVTANDYRLGLYNGDVGVVTAGERGGELMAVFPAAGSAALRSIAPARLPRVETAFATTVHKSQGSEFDTVVLILPDADSPVLSRELLYTAVTRARREVHIWGTQQVLEAAVARKTVRMSGLGELLWGKG